MMLLNRRYQKVWTLKPNCIYLCLPTPLEPLTNNTKYTSLFFFFSLSSSLFLSLSLLHQSSYFSHNDQQVPSFSNARPSTLQRLWLWPSNKLFSGFSSFFSPTLLKKKSFFFLFLFAFTNHDVITGVGRSHEAQARDGEIHRLHPLQAPKAHFQGRIPEQSPQAQEKALVEKRPPLFQVALGPSPGQRH